MNQVTGSNDDEFLRRLPREVRSWEAGGIITPEQGESILGSYPTAARAPAAYHAQGRLVTAVSIVGSILVGLGVIFFVASNWGEIGRFPKLAVMVAALVAAQGLGYYLNYIRGYRRLGTAFTLLACLIYGAGIHLIGQIYHVELNHPNLTLFWFLGVLPLMYITRSQPIQFLGLVLLLVTIGFQFGNWIDHVDSRQSITGAALFLIVGLALLELGRIKEEIAALRQFAPVFQAVGLITVLGSIYVLTFKEWYDHRVPAFNSIDTGYWPLAAVAGGLALALAAASVWRRQRNGGPIASSLAEGAAVAVALAAAYVVASGSGISGSDASEAIFAVLFNALLGLALLGVLVAGYLNGRELWVNIALAFIGLDVITRYFEYSWGLLDRSFIFIAAGVILLVGGYLVERGRRRMLGHIRAGGGAR